MHLTRRFATSVTLVLSVGLITSAAWGTSAGAGTLDGAATRALPKACDLFTPAIAAAALGGPVDAPAAKKPNPHETICQYKRTDGSAFGSVSVGPWLFVQVVGGGAKIKGIGDEAEGKDPFGVSVRKGSDGFNVDLSLAVGTFTGAAADQQSAANIAAATNVAKQLVANFGGKAKPKSKKKKGK